MDPPNFTVMAAFIGGYSRFGPGRSDAAADFLRCLSASGVVEWADVSGGLPRMFFLLLAVLLS